MAGLLIGDNNFSTGTLGSGVTFPSGHVINVFFANFTATMSFGGTNHQWYDITSLTHTITPASESSKFYIMTRVSVGAPTGTHQHIAISAGGSQVNIADSSGTNGVRLRSSSIAGLSDTWALENITSNYLWDANTASDVIIKTQWASEGANVYINRSNRDTDAIYDGRASSDLTVMEIAS